MSNKPEMLSVALDYATRGWLVIPLHLITPDGRCTCSAVDCGSPGKHPRTEHGLTDATTDETPIRRWWTRWPSANVGIATGAVSGLVVLDVDPRHGGGESLNELERRIGKMSTTVEVLTGGGGRHLYYRHPGNGQVIRNATALAGLSGLDLRGDGGCVVAPPSLHASGRRYEWEVSSHPDDVPLAPFPPSLVVGFAELRPDARRRDGDRDEARRIPEGERNATLASFGGTMRRRGMSAAAIGAALLAENAACCEPPLPDHEVRAIAKSVARYTPGATVAPHRGVLRELNGNDLATGDPNLSDLCYLPMLGQRAYVVLRWTHLLSGYPRAGKTELLVAVIREWLDLGYRALYITEESEDLWRKRLARRPGDWSRLTVVFGLGADPTDLLARAFTTGTEEIVVVDALRNLLRLRDETDNSEIARVVNPWVVGAREAGRTLVAVHHDRKGGGEHGEAIAGGHAFLGVFDVALELLWTNSAQPRRRTVRAYARVVSPPEFVYELEEDGTMTVLGAPAAVALGAVVERVYEVVELEWRKTSELAAALGDPNPSEEQVRKALLHLAAAGRIERDPPLGADVPGKAHRWRRVTGPPTTDRSVGGGADMTRRAPTEAPTEPPTGARGGVPGEAQPPAPPPPTEPPLVGGAVGEGEGPDAMLRAALDAFPGSSVIEQES